MEQRCTIKFCARLKKMPSETTALLKEAFGKELLGYPMIQRWHKAFVDGCVCGTTLHDQILCAFKENAE